MKFVKDRSSGRPTLAFRITERWVRLLGGDGASGDAVQFPDTQVTAISDCATPTTLTLSDGNTVTFSGGQFVHYEDNNFVGTMYMTSSAAGCQRTGPETDIFNQPATEVTIVFSKPVSQLVLRDYNLLPPPDTTFEGNLPSFGITLWDAAGNGLVGIGQSAPSHLMMPDPIFYPISVPGFPTTPVAKITFRSFLAKEDPQRH